MFSCRWNAKKGQLSLQDRWSCWNLLSKELRATWVFRFFREQRNSRFSSPPSSKPLSKESRTKKLSHRCESSLPTPRFVSSSSSLVDFILHYLETISTTSRWGYITFSLIRSMYWPVYVLDRWNKWHKVYLSSSGLNNHHRISLRKIWPSLTSYSEERLKIEVDLKEMRLRKWKWWMGLQWIE